MSNPQEDDKFLGTRTFSTLHTPSPLTLLSVIPLPNLSHPTYLHNQTAILENQNVSRNFNLTRDSTSKKHIDNLHLLSWDDKSTHISEHDVALNKIAELLNERVSERIPLNNLGASKVQSSNISEVISEVISGKQPQQVTPLMSRFLNVVQHNSNLQNLNDQLQSKNITTIANNFPTEHTLSIRTQKFGKTPVARKRKKQVETDITKAHLKSDPQEDKENIDLSPIGVAPKKRLGSILGALSPQKRSSQNTQQHLVDQLEIFLLDVINFYQLQKSKWEASQNESQILEDLNQAQNISISSPMKTNPLIDFHTMDRLYTEVARSIEGDFLRYVEEDKIKQLLFILLEVIIDTSTLFFNEENTILDIEKNENSILISLKAIQLSLELMTYDYKNNNPTTFIIEEVVEALVDQLKKLVHEYIIPSMQSGKQISQLCSQVVVRVCSILALVDELIQLVDLKDEFILRITNLTIGTYFVEGLSKIQLASFSIVVHIFANYPSHRTNCLQTIISSVLSLSMKKNVERKFKLDSLVSVQTFSVLIVQLIQSCSGFPGILPSQNENIKNELDLHDPPIDKEHTLNLEDIDKLSDYYKRSQVCANIFIKSLLEHCSSSSCDGDSRKIIEHFIDDLLAMLPRIEFPAADIILQLTCKGLYKIYLESENIPEKFRVCAIQLLGKIACKSRELSLNSRLADEKKALKEKILRAFENDSREDLSILKDVATKSTWNTRTYCQLLVFKYLCSQEQGWHLYSRQYAISQWYYDDDLHDKHKEYYATLYNLDPTLLLGINSARGKNILHDAQVYILNKRKSSSVNSSEYILRNLLIYLRDEKAKLRSAAIKSVKDIVDSDFRVMENSEIANAIIERQNDESILVRESVLQLVGSVLDQSTHMLKTTPIFIPMILRGLNDKGLSVRKRCIRILTSVYKFDIAPRLKTEIAVSLAKRLKDTEDDSVHELVLKSFNEIWFQIRSTKDNQLKLSALQISSAVGEFGLSNTLDINHYWLTKLLKLNNDNDLSKKLVDTLFNLLLEDYTKERNITALMTTLYIFCHSNSYNFKSYSMTLIGFLNQEFIQQRKDDSLFFVYLFRVLNHVISIMNAPGNSTKAEILKTFQNVMFRTCTLVETAFELCVNCMVLFCKRFEKNATLLKLVLALFKHIQTTSYQSVRVIKILCLICRYFDFRSIPQEELNEFGISSPSDIEDEVYTSALKMAISNDPLISSTAVLGLSALVIRNPSYFVDVRFTEALQLLFKSKDPNVTTALLELFEKYFEAIEETLTSAQGEQMDNSISMGIIPRYINQFLDFVSSPDSLVREKALNVIGVVLRQGLYIPQVCIPYVIALQSDPIEAVRNQAISICQAFYERHSNELRVMAAKGMFLSYDILQSQFPNGVRHYNARFLFHRFYILLCTFSRSNRNHAMDSFLKCILTADDKNVDRLCYFTNIIAQLPYGNLEEVYHVICSLTRHIDQYSAEAIATLKELKKLQEHELSTSESREKLCSCIMMYITISLTAFLQSTYGAKSTLLGKYEDSNPSKQFDRPCVKYMTNISLNFESLFQLIANPIKGNVIQFCKQLKVLHDEYMDATVDDFIVSRQIASSRRVGRPRKDVETQEVILTSETNVHQSVIGLADESNYSLQQNDKIQKIGSTPVVTRKRKRGTPKNSPKRSPKNSPKNRSERSPRKRQKKECSDDDEDYIP